MRQGRSLLTHSRYTAISSRVPASSRQERSYGADRYADGVAQAMYTTQHELSQRIQVAVAGVAIFVLGWSLLVRGFTGILFPLAVFVAVAGFRRMKVEVNATMLTVAFDYGWPRRTVELVDIDDVSVHRMRAIYGWGIRIVRNGTLWRAAGHNAVRLELSSGRYLYIGAADCDELAREISERLPAR